MSSKIRIATRGFPSLHYLEVNAYAEVTEHKKYRMFSDVVFLSCSFQYDRAKTLTMQIKNNDLRALAYGIKECIKNGKSSYIKYTDPRAAGGAGTKKSISLAVEKGTIYINIKNKEDNLAFGYDFYQMAALADTITLIAEESDKRIFQLQSDNNILQLQPGMDAYGLDT